MDQPIAEMLGDEMAGAVLAARARLSDASVTVRCEAGLWTVERAGAPVVEGLAFEAALAEVGALA